MLNANELSSPQLIINRIRPELVKKGDMMSIEDVQEILAVNLLGIVPDDGSIIVSANKGEPAVTNDNSLAGAAYRNIVNRILGQEIPFIDLEQGVGFINKIKKLFRVAN